MFASCVSPRSCCTSTGRFCNPDPAESPRSVAVTVSTVVSSGSSVLRSLSRGMPVPAISPLVAGSASLSRRRVSMSRLVSFHLTLKPERVSPS